MNAIDKPKQVNIYIYIYIPKSYLWFQNIIT